MLLQALTKPLADSPLSTCGAAVLSWKGTSLSELLTKENQTCLFWFGTTQTADQRLYVYCTKLYLVIPSFSAHAGDGRTVQLVHLLLGYFLPHAIQTAGGRRSSHLRDQTKLRLQRHWARSECGDVKLLTRLMTRQNAESFLGYETKLKSSLCFSNLRFTGKIYIYMFFNLIF